MTELTERQMREELTVDLVREQLGYDPETGGVTWLVSRRGIRAGTAAASSFRKGYCRVFLAGREFPAHRLIWFWMTGEWPKHQIDHINRNKSDNRWCNLREATNSQNINSPVKADNTSGFHGVGFDKRRQKWAARIRVAGKRIMLGRFDSAEGAFIAYIFAAWKHHGEFANIDADYIRVVKKRRALEQKRRLLKTVVLWNLANPDPNYLAVGEGCA
jgi:hypothetical protein